MRKPFSPIKRSSPRPQGALSTPVLSHMGPDGDEIQMAGSLDGGKGEVSSPSSAFTPASTERRPIKRPRFQVRISIVAMVLVAAVLLTPALLTGIAILHVENVRQEYVPKGQMSVALAAADELTSLLCEEGLRAVSSVANALSGVLADIEHFAPYTSSVASTLPDSLEAAEALSLNQSALVDGFCRGDIAPSLQQWVSAESAGALSLAATAIANIVHSPNSFRARLAANDPLYPWDGSLWIASGVSVDTARTTAPPPRTVCAFLGAAEWECKALVNDSHAAGQLCYQDYSDPILGAALLRRLRPPTYRIVTTAATSPAATNTTTTPPAANVTALALKCSGNRSFAWPINASTLASSTSLNSSSVPRTDPIIGLAPRPGGVDAAALTHPSWCSALHAHATGVTLAFMEYNRSAQCRLNPRPPSGGAANSRATAAPSVENASSVLAVITTAPVAFPRFADARRSTSRVVYPLGVAARTYVNLTALSARLRVFADNYASRLVLWSAATRQAVWCVAPPASFDDDDAAAALLQTQATAAMVRDDSEAAQAACRRATQLLTRLSDPTKPPLTDTGDSTRTISSPLQLFESAAVLDDLLVAGAPLQCTQRGVRLNGSSTGGAGSSRPCRGEWAVFAFRPRQQYLSLLFSARGRLVATAFGIGVTSVVLMLLLMRSLVQPVRSLTRAIQCCATLRLEAIQLMEASTVAEIAQIQKSVSYLAIRLFHYARFLPDRVVAQRIGEEEASESSESSSGSDDDGGGDDDDGGGSTRSRRRKNRSRLPSTISSKSSTDSNAPIHSIAVVASCEHISTGNFASRLLGAGRAGAENGPGIRHTRTARFMFHYRVTDPVLAMLQKQVRMNLKERPGEVLLLFVETSRTNGSKRQLVTNDDVLFAIEFFANSGDLAVLNLTVLQGATKARFPLLIAASTVINAVLRVVLSGARLNNPVSTIQMLGLLLLVCVAMQVVQNVLVSAYLLRRFASSDEDFREWRRVSRSEERFGLFVGAFNVTNIEVLSCHMSIGQLRLTAPLKPALLTKIRKYSFLGFFIGDLVPFIIVAIETILSKTYRDPVVLLSTLASVMSLSSILVRHGVIRFVVDAAQDRNSVRSTQSTTLQLARKDVTVLRLSLGDEAHLLATLPLEQFDELSDALYAVVAPIIKRFGGLMVHCDGFTHTVYFNAHNVILNHAHVARVAFDAVAAAARNTFLPQLLQALKKLQPLPLLPDEEKDSSSKTHHYKSEFRETPGAVLAEVQSRVLRIRHRLVASIVTGEMCVGYVGTLTSQSFQHVDEHATLSDSLCKFNTFLGTTVLCNDAAARVIQAEERAGKTLLRRVDHIRCLWSLNGGDSNVGDTADGGAANASSSSGGSVALTTYIWDVMNVDSVPGFYFAAAGKLVSRADGVQGSSASKRDGAATEHGFALIDQPGVEAASQAQAMRTAVDQFNGAMEMLFTMRSASGLTRYAKSYPHDVTAGRVQRWGSFLNSDNEVEAVTFPRLLGPLGLQLHRCELDPSLLPRVTQGLQSMLQQGSPTGSSPQHRRGASPTTSAATLKRPPRSTRRLLQAAGAPTQLPMLERVMCLDKFDIEFAPLPQGAEDGTGSPTRATLAAPIIDL